MEMGGDFYTGLWLEMIFIPRLRAYKSGVVLKSGGSDVEAAKRRPLLHVSQSNYFYIFIYILSRDFMLALLEILETVQQAFGTI